MPHGIAVLTVQHQVRDIESLIADLTPAFHAEVERLKRKAWDFNLLAPAEVLISSGVESAWSTIRHHYLKNQPVTGWFFSPIPACSLGSRGFLRTSREVSDTLLIKSLKNGQI
ncbi:MAG: hypothetical protein IPH37_19350 [Burkholderiales bacterium]|nr:hypothetical protein [Burkholderiales bacterium]